MKAGVIHKPAYGYDIGDFVNTEVCKLERVSTSESAAEPKSEEAKPEEEADKGTGAPSAYHSI